MNNKGQVGMLIMIAVAIIVGAVLLTGNGGIAGNVATMTTTPTIYNETVTIGAVPLALSGREVVSYLVTNATDGKSAAAANFTTYDNRLNATTQSLYWAINISTTNDINGSVNISYTYKPQGYPEDAASRSMLGLIVIFCVIAIVVVAILPTLKNSELFTGR